MDDFRFSMDDLLELRAELTKANRAAQWDMSYANLRRVNDLHDAIVRRREQTIHIRSVKRKVKPDSATTPNPALATTFVATPDQGPLLPSIHGTQSSATSGATTDARQR